ncbi:MAG: hypothetical protein OXG78_15690 [Chloroflexi bacterium]|nr:hypothetical protein [Chloroflexota bacterium]
MNAALYALPTDHIKSYLLRSGWNIVNTNDRCYVFEGYADIDDNPFEIVLPLSCSAPDYPIYVEHTVRILSALADKSPETIANEILLFDRDLLMIKVDERSVDDAATYTPRIKGLIGHAANSESDLRPYFARYNSAAKRMLDHFEISRKHNGGASYLVESQVGEVMPYQRELIPNRPDPGRKLPLERRVMERISTGFITVEKAKRQHDVQPLVSGFADGFNANMCDALLKMYEQSAAPIQYSVQWSKNLPISRGVKVVKNFVIERQHIEYLRMASDFLKEWTPQLQRIKGLVIGLSSLVDPQSDEVDDDDRSIIVLWDHGRGRPRRLRINLGKKDYLKAIKAHSDWSTISVDGEALQRRSGWELVDPHDFKIIR